MSIWNFIIYLGIINIIFGFVWKWVFALPLSLLCVLLKFSYGTRIIKMFGGYLLVSLIALLTLVVLSDKSSISAIVFYPIIGAVILFMGYANTLYKTRKEALESQDFQMLAIVERDYNFDHYFLFGAVIFYLVVLFIPSIAQNALTQWLFKIIEWVYGLPVIGWIIGIGGVLFLLNIVFQGILAIGFLSVSLSEKFSRKKESGIIIENNLETYEK